MPRNLGETRLKSRRRTEDPMREFDKLPPVLRSWLAHAALPWRPKSVKRAYDKALSQTGCPTRALAALDLLQAKRLAADHPPDKRDR